MDYTKQRIGIFGGAFDPIHNGHLVVAKNILDSLCLEKIIFVPTGDAPHKNIKSDKKNRLNMLKLALENESDFEVNEYEINKSEKSYTSETVRYFKEKNPYAEIYLIIGSDEFIEIETWHDMINLLENCILIVALRPDFDNKNFLLDYLRRIKRKYSSNVFLFEVNAQNISSELIRNRILLNKNIDFLVPKKVCEYIKQKDLYRHSLKINTDAIKKFLIKTLSPRRFIHSVCVANIAVDLAKRYNGDIFKAYVGGLLHDCAKEIPNNEKIRMCDYYGIEIDKILMMQPDLLHQFLGASLAYSVFYIRDVDILNAVRYHTTGRQNMSLLEKIIYLADYTEPNRIHENVKYIRKLVYEDLDRALAYCLKITLDENKKRNRMIYSLSNEAFEFYKDRL